MELHYRKQKNDFIVPAFRAFKRKHFKYIEIFAVIMDGHFLNTNELFEKLELNILW